MNTKKDELHRNEVESTSAEEEIKPVVQLVVTLLEDGQLRIGISNEILGRNDILRILQQVYSIISSGNLPENSDNGVLPS